jgi:EthD domain
MTDALIAFYRRPSEETPAQFGQRLRSAAEALADDDRATEVVAFVDDGESGAPKEAHAYASTFDGALVFSGLPLDAAPTPDAAYAVGRRVIKARDRGRDGARTEGFTILCPSVRLPFLTHEQFDAHWRDNHSRVHVKASPGTCHYEQLIINEALTPDAPEWDGVGLLSFASATEYTERLFDGEAGQKAIFEDIPRFVDIERGETLPATEYVYRDDA